MVPFVEDVLFSGSKKAAFETKVKCYACAKPFMIGKWREHRKICEKQRVECACGQEITANHTLNEDGTLKGNEYSGEMTAHDMHVWYECELVRSRCKTCGWG